ncbi:hypothetical protein BX266_6601 [Streptomyces sp. TLI_171]|nr:hypothetical protein BX266_6601 [Streptomyces sp. TLI_171]
MPGTETDRPSRELTGLRAIWADTLQPVAPLPRYRRVSLKLVAAGVLVGGLATALVVAAVTGAGAPPRAAHHRSEPVPRVGEVLRSAGGR